MSATVAILRDIKLSHSVFALPFAAVGLLIGTRGAAPSLRLGLLIVAAMVLARSAAMAFNRLADARFDATNPRTEGRALPSGRVGRREMTAFCVLCAVGFVVAAGLLNPLCLWLSPVVLAVLFGYSLFKRFSLLAHGAVGVALALSPPAAYLAARGAVAADVIPVLWLSVAVACWVAGFDIIYACQDVGHDRAEGLHSLPAAVGVPRALLVARILHALMVLALLQVHATAGLGRSAWYGIALVGVLLVIEHWLVAGGDLRRVNAAFFTVNGVVSVLFAIFVGADLLWP